jgi:hypothetical protein
MQDIKKIGKEHFKFEVIAEYKNRRSLRYYELYYQMKFNVLSSTFEGTDEPAYYNSRVGGKFYRPVESYQDPEYRKKMSESIRNSKAWYKAMKDPENRKKQSEGQKKAYKNNPEYKKKRLAQLNKYRNTKKDPVTGRFIKHNVHTT